MCRRTVPPAARWPRRSTGTAGCGARSPPIACDDRNQLPREVRAKIVSLSLWITKYSKQVMREGASVEPLIEINRTIMQGLQGAA